jgi:hypothetical protein
MTRSRSLLRRLIVVTVALVLAPREAGAYPWMIREGYTGCASCHADPSGAGLLTAYGRALSEVLLSTFPRVKDEEASQGSQAAFGLLPEPEGFLYSFALRSAAFATKTGGDEASARAIVMQADLRSQVTIAEGVRVNGSVGFVPLGGQLAAVLPDNAFQLVSREHWIGVDLGENRDVLLRAGRIAVPYGLRGNEHPMWVRSGARTDIAFHQQHGVAVSRTTESYRTEWMALFGNYQVTPDLYRERGYAGFYEHVLGRGATLGLSSMVTHADGDLFRSRRQPILRHAHGLFARWVATPAVVVLGQADIVARHPSGKEADAVGAAGLAQLDVELVRGVHVMPALEVQKARFGEGGVNAGAWLSLAFFPYAHLETRVDVIGRSVDAVGGRVANVSGLLSVHLYL